MRHVQFLPKSHLNEAISTGLAYSLIKPVGDEKDSFLALHPPVHCKDFISDAFWSENTKKPFDLYGFKWKPGTMCISPNVPQSMAITYHDQDIASTADSLQIFLNHWENTLGFPNTNVVTANDGKALLLRFGSWEYLPVLLSAYTLLVRIGLGYVTGEAFDYCRIVAKEGNPFCSADKARVAESLDGLYLLWHRYVKLFKQKWSNYPDMHSIHYKSGIATFGSSLAREAAVVGTTAPQPGLQQTIPT